MSYLGYFIRIFAILIAFAHYKKALNLINFIIPLIPGNLSAGNEINTALSIYLAPIKSVNHVPSTDAEQQSLLVIEENFLLNEILKDEKGMNKDRDTAMNNNNNINKKIQNKEVFEVDMKRWLESSFPSVTSLPDSTFIEISKTILCVNGLHGNEELNSNLACEGIKSIVKNSLFGIKDKQRIILAFRMKLEVTPCSAATLRLKLHNNFIRNLWPAILKNVNFALEDREIIFVGYESGGSLASLAAWRAIKEFDRFKPSGRFISNSNNQVKVITWDELPMFTRSTAFKCPILLRNYSRYTSMLVGESKIRKITQFSGGINESQYFASSGEEIFIRSGDYNDFSARIISPRFDPKKQDWNPLNYFPLFIKKKFIDSFTFEENERISALLSLHHQHLSIMHGIISNNYRNYIMDSVLSEPNSCAAALSNHLSSSIFTESNVNCRVSNFDSFNGTFKMYCSYKTKKNQVSVQFLSFDAVLGNNEANLANKPYVPFMQEVEFQEEYDTDSENKIESEIKGKEDKKKHKKQNKKGVQDAKDKKIKITKALKYTGPFPVLNDWSHCIYDLFDQKPVLSILSPFSIIKDNTIHPQCSYLPFAENSFFTLKSGSKNTGCYLRSPNVSTELFQIYKSNPTLFYQTVDQSIMEFPTSCFKVLFHVPFKANEREGLESLESLSVKYFTELTAMNPFANSKVSLWQPLDTAHFKTLAFMSSENVSSKELSDRSNYETDFENEIIKCLSNPSYPYRDCTDPINKWVPMACPAACSQKDSSPDFLCKQVKSCPPGGYYISISSSGTIDKLKIFKTNLMNMKHSNPQFGLFHLQSKGKVQSSHFGPTKFNIGLFRMPSLSI